MADDFRNIPVPPEIEADVMILIEKVHEAVDDGAHFSKDDITLIKPDARQFAGGEIPPAVLHASVTVLGWLAEAWVKKYVVPIILKSRPSKQFERWLKAVQHSKK
jgi:hypothetical protein